MLALYYTRYESPLGEILLLANEQALTGVWLPGQQPDTGQLAQAVKQDRAPVLGSQTHAAGTSDGSSRK
mgnify:CR=1 FL=1